MSGHHESAEPFRNHIPKNNIVLALALNAPGFQEEIVDADMVVKMWVRPSFWTRVCLDQSVRDRVEMPNLKCHHNRR